MNFIYHVFSKTQTPIFEWQRYPTILSIATLRNFDQISPIYIIDRSPQFHDWRDFPQRLNFQVVNVTSPVFKQLPLIHHRYADVARIVNDLSSGINIYSDSDIFWLKPFEPCQSPGLSIQAKFQDHYWRVNSGFFYFQSNSPGQRMLDLWAKTITEWQSDRRAMFKFLKDFYGYPSRHHISGEGTLGYLINQKDMANRINPLNEPALIHRKGATWDLSQVGSIHMLSHFSNQKIPIIFGTHELNRILRNTLTHEDFKMFGYKWEFKGLQPLKNIHRLTQPMLA